MLAKEHEFEQSGRQKDEDYGKLLREITEKDPLNHVYITKYARWLVQDKQLQV